jgi:hypothetical protein
MSMNAPADDSPFDEYTTAGLAVTLYASDGVSTPLSTTMVFSNLRYVLMIGTQRGNIIVGLLPSSVTAAPGQVIQVTSTGRWYVIAKVSDESVPFLYNPGVSVALLRLPDVLTVTRTVQAVTPMHRNGFGEPYSPSDTTVTTRTIRAGDSNGNDPFTGQDLGPLPKGVYTLYCPLGSDVQLGDQLTLRDGTKGTVQQKNPADADGDYYAWQLLVNQV